MALDTRAEVIAHETERILRRGYQDDQDAKELKRKPGRTGHDAYRAMHKAWGLGET